MSEDILIAEGLNFMQAFRKVFRSQIEYDGIRYMACEDIMHDGQYVIIDDNDDYVNGLHTWTIKGACWSVYEKAEEQTEEEYHNSPRSKRSNHAAPLDNDKRRIDTLVKRLTFARQWMEDVIAHLLSQDRTLSDEVCLLERASEMLPCITILRKNSKEPFRVTKEEVEATVLC